nr:hypothetical protein [Escherichia coli]
MLHCYQNDTQLTVASLLLDYLRSFESTDSSCVFSGDQTLLAVDRTLDTDGQFV